MINNSSNKDEFLQGEILSKEAYKDTFENADANEAKNADKVRDGFWRTIAKAAKHIPQIEKFVAAYYCAFDEETPNKTRGILLAALAYFVLPVDLVPDFLAGFGFTDDIAVLTIAINSIQSAIGPQHLEAAKRKLASSDEMSK